MLENISLHSKKPEEVKQIQAMPENFDSHIELATQYISTKNLYESIVSDDAVPANQKAQVANSLLAALKAYVDLQEKVLNIKRLKAQEEALIKTLKTLPEEAQKLFFESYEAELALIK